MKNVHHPRGKRLLAMLVSIIATGSIITTQIVHAKSPPNIVTDIEWSAGYTGVTDIMAAFNNARRNEEMQLGLTHNALGELTLPTQAVWNGMSDDAKALYLINAERTARAGMQSGVLGLPLAGIETKIDNLAKNYAQLLHDNSWTGHHRPSNNPNIDSPFIRIENGLGTNCREFMSRAENLAYFGSSATIPLPVERSIYAWIYDDASSSWGHREAVLLQDTPLNNPTQTWGFKNNHGASAHEGFLGIHHISSTSYKPFGNSYTYGSVVVMKMFDPVSDANAGSCGYNVTLRTEDLPVPGATNQPPVAGNDSATTTPGTAVTIANVLSNDSDPDGHTLTITGNTNPTKGTVTRSGSNFTYTPNTGISNTTDSFTYTISDGNGGTATATVTITIGAAANRVPVAGNDSATTTPGTAVTVTNVLSNDSDPDGHTLTITGNTNPTKGTVTRSGSNFTYTPNTGISNTMDSFTYTISDGNGGTATATVTITIGASVTGPKAVEDVATTNFGEAVTVNLLENDTPKTGVTVNVVTQPKKGRVTIHRTTGVAKYTPNKGQEGTDTFSYSITNAARQSSTALVTIVIKPLVKPVAQNDTASTKFNTPVTIKVLENDTGTGLALVSATKPTKGKVTLNTKTGQATYTPNKGTSGNDTFAYTVKNTVGGTATANVSVTVATNTPPVVTNWFYSVSIGKPREINFMHLHSSDINGDQILANQVMSKPTKGTVSIKNGRFIYMPKKGAVGSDSFTYTVKDQHGAVSNTATINLNISNVPSS